MRLVKSNWTLKNFEFFFSILNNKLYFSLGNKIWQIDLNKDFYFFENFLNVKGEIIQNPQQLNIFDNSKNLILNTLNYKTRRLLCIRSLSKDFFSFKHFCKSFFYISNIINKKLKNNNSFDVNFYFNEIKLYGLGFRVKKITNKIHRLYLGFSNFIYIFSTEQIIIKYSQILKRLFIFSNSKQELKNFLAIFFLLKPLSPYRLYGSTTPNKLIFLKTGKKR